MPYPSDEEIVQAYHEMRHQRRVSKHLKVSESYVVKRLKVAGVVIKPWRRYPLNETYFDQIDSEEKAYFLGFLLADGCNTLRGAVSLKLVTDDMAILERLRACIESTSPLYHWKGKPVTSKQGKVYQARPICGLLLSSRRLSQRLIDLGMVPNKTTTLRVPISSIPHHLWGHFVRGCFDGDGSITKILVNGHKKHTYHVEYCAKNRAFAQDIINMTQEAIGIKFSICSDSSIFKLRLNRHELKVPFLDWLYQDATIYLQRKYDRYLAARAAKEEWDARRNPYPKGISFHSRDRKFCVRVRENKRVLHLGAFKTEAEAVECITRYRSAQIAH